MTAADHPRLADLERCFTGVVPAVLATASADGIPNVTYLSRAHRVDDERIALSNQFMSKTARNLAVNPRASLLLTDHLTHDQYRLTVVYERTERRGRVFEQLRTDVDAIAALTGMQDVFRLRAADIFRVLDIVRQDPNPAGSFDDPRPDRSPGPELAGLAELAACLGRCGDLETLVDTALDCLDRLLGHPHSLLLLADETASRLYTVGAHGYDAEGIGSEVAVGDGLVGLAAARCQPTQAGNLIQMAKYARSVRLGFEEAAALPARDVPMPGLPGADSRLAVPVMAAGQLVGVLVVDSTRAMAYDDVDQHVLATVASILGPAIEHVRALEQQADPGPEPATAPSVAAAGGGAARVRFFGADGSVFVDGEYLIKGVAGRILWTLLAQHVREGRTDFTNKELRLDPSLGLPGFKDNLESRLLLLKRRLDERRAPVRLEKTGRGRFRLQVHQPLRLDPVDGA